MSIYNSYVVPPPVYGGSPVLRSSQVLRTVPTVTVPTVQPRYTQPVVVQSVVQPSVVADNAYFTNAFKAVALSAIPLGFLWHEQEKLAALYANGLSGSFLIFTLVTFAGCVFGALFGGYFTRVHGNARKTTCLGLLLSIAW